MPSRRDLDPSAVTTLLCDADGTLFPSEDPAFEASVTVTNRFLARLGSARRYETAELQLVSLGRNFRSLAADLVREHGASPTRTELEDWVTEEQRAVTKHLVEVLRPDPAVDRPLRHLAGGLTMSVVSSSALDRVLACLRATGLDDLFPTRHVLSAQDSLPVPGSKPDPAVYRWALTTLGAAPEESLAVEDAVAGVRSAVGAGIPTVGLLQFVPEPERARRRTALLDAGARAVLDDWSALADQLTAEPVSERAP